MAKLLSSPLVSASNNIVLFAKGTKQLPRVQRQLVQFDQFIRTKTVELEKLKLPDKKKIKELAKLNIASSFGAPGRLLSKLASGALDVAGFLGNMFPSKGKTGKPGKIPRNIKAPKPIASGTKLKLGGIRAVGVVNALFAGLDFATGLQEGESVGKAAAGAGGSLAGSLLGGAIGQALIPIPGVGFVLGSMAGGFLGGYAADRVYEGGSYIKKKLSERLKKQEVTQRAAASSGNFGDIVSKFSSAVSKFEQGVASGSFGSISRQGADQTTNQSQMNYEPDTKPIDTGNKPESTGLQLEDAEVSGGEVPGNPDSRFRTSDRPGHNGNDYFKNAGTPISLIQEGTVSVADMNYNPGGWGALVEVRHKDGSLSRYAHLSKISVSAGSKIAPGQVVGYTGGAAGAYGSGNSTGPHLHFEYLPAGSKQIDPTQVAKKIFRFGGNVKVKPKAGVSGKGSDPFVLELHADPNAKGQKTGLIPSNTSPDTAVSQALVSMFGTYGKNYRGGLGVTNRGGNMLESDMSLGVESNAKRIVEAMMKDPKRAYHIFAGHADVTKGETGAGGEKEYNLKTAELVERLAKAQKLNVEYHKSIITNKASDPNSNFSRIKAIMDDSKRPGISGAEADPKIPERYNRQSIQQYPTYNQQQSSVTIMPIMMGGGQGGGGGQQQKPVFIPVGGGGGGGTVILPGPSEGAILNSLWKTMLLTNLSAA